MIPYRLWVLLAYTRIPGNAFSFWIRKTLRWSRGAPQLPGESKENLFAYLGEPEPAPSAGLLPASAGTGGARGRAEAREAELRDRYDLESLRARSTAALYRKNLYLIDVLELATTGAGPLPQSTGTLRALDAGSQDFHYAFGLERWLKHADAGPERAVSLTGVEIDGHGIYPDFRSRKDYAQAYAAQTGNSDVTYRVGDLGRESGGPYDMLTWFYPFVTRHHLLLWGLPLRFFRPASLLERAAALVRPGGWMLTLAHTEPEHKAFLALAQATGSFTLLREGSALSELVDFHADVRDRRYSLWLRR